MIIKVPLKDDGYRMFDNLSSVEWSLREEGPPLTSMEGCFDSSDCLEEQNTENKSPRRIYEIWGFNEKDSIQIYAYRAYILNDEGKTIERL